jgi:hypothetical protein
MLQAGRWQVRFSTSLNFINLPNPSIRTMALEFTQPLTGIGILKKIFPGDKVRPEVKADNLTAICDPIF